jgi:hypothetical protein
LKLSCIAGFAIASILLSAQAQTPVPPPPPAAGPTMEQTIAFINEAFASLGSYTKMHHKPPYLIIHSQRAYLEQPCLLRYEMRNSYKTSDIETDTFGVRMNLADPRTVEVISLLGGEWGITLKNDRRQPPEILNGEARSEDMRNETMDLATFPDNDKDTADRVAKAYIHAIVLCHQSEKRSLF